MGCLGSYQTGQVYYQPYQGQYAVNQNQNQYVAYQNQYVKKQNQIIIQYPDPKYFEFDPNFLKDCDNIQKETSTNYEYEGNERW